MRLRITPKPRLKFKYLKCKNINNSDRVSAMNVLTAGQAVKSHPCGGYGISRPTEEAEPPQALQSWL
jgi:hypothetical protein